MRYLLFNPASGKMNRSEETAKSFFAIESRPASLVNMTEIRSLADFFETLECGDDVTVFGGDGTLNRLANELDGRTVNNDIYYFPCGTGNDFARDLGKADTEAPILINGYIKDLPKVTVKGRQKRFINGVGFGIDGYCCEVGDRLKSLGKQPNYTAIAIKGLLFHFKPVRATVTVDGVEHSFGRVWIAPTMHGRYYGGGMMPAPRQDRTAADRRVSLMVFHGSGKLRTLMIFPSLFKGEHVKHKKNVSILEGKRITVSFDRPTPLQIDGETVTEVLDYSVEV